MTRAAAATRIADATRRTRFRLDVKCPGTPFVPRSFHATFDEAFCTGLKITTDQAEEASEPHPGWDFVVRGARS